MVSPHRFQKAPFSSYKFRMDFITPNFISTRHTSGQYGYNLLCPSVRHGFHYTHFYKIRSHRISIPDFLGKDFFQIGRQMHIHEQISMYVINASIDFSALIYTKLLTDRQNYKKLENTILHSNLPVNTKC